MKSLVPPLSHRYDFIEIATGDLGAAEAIFAKLGFYATQESISTALKQRLLIQGRVRVLLSQGEPGTYQHEYVEKNGEGLCSIGYHVESAKKALHHMRQAKSKVVQEFVNDETDEMFLQSSAVESVGGMRVIFVTRSGAPHDVNAQFAPSFRKLDNVQVDPGVGILTFSSIMDPDAANNLRITFACADSQKSIASLKERGFESVGDTAFQLPLFAGNRTAQLFLHFRKI